MPVYFIRAGDDGPVKIGWAVDVPARVGELQCGNPEPLALLRVVDGCRLVEAAFHRLFSAQHLRGEWFRFDAAMLVLDPPPVATKPDRRPNGLAAYLDEQRMTLREFGALVGAHEITIHNWAAGKAIPRRKSMKAISAATNGKVTAGSFYLPAPEPAQ